MWACEHLAITQKTCLQKGCPRYIYVRCAHAFLNFFLKFVFLLVNNLLPCCVIGHCTHHFLSLTAFRLANISRQQKKEEDIHLLTAQILSQIPVAAGVPQKHTEKTLLVIWIHRRYEVQRLNWGKICTWFLMSLRVLMKVHPMLFASSFFLES